MIKNEKEIESMRKGGKLLGSILKHLESLAVPGASTQELNTIAEKMIAEGEAKPAFKGYSMSGLYPYPCALCVSINEEVVHGLAVPDRILQEGDIVGLDCGLVYEGMYLDSALTVGVGAISEEAHHLMSVTRKALDIAIAQVQHGVKTGDLGSAVQEYVESEGLGVIRELVGHGVGHGVHEPPHVPNYGRAGTGDRLVEGMTIAIEPMVSLGDWNLTFYDRDWPVITKDRSLSAHYEHTVLVTKKGAEVLTIR